MIIAAALVGRRDAGCACILVSSGAIAAGMKPLKLRNRPRDLATQQAAASVGQGLLIESYARAFGRHDTRVGQILLTSDDVMGDLTVSTFNEAGQPVEDDRMAFGTDGLLGTTDDVVQGVTTTTYDPNGGRSAQTLYNSGPDGMFKTPDDTKNQCLTFDPVN